MHVSACVKRYASLQTVVYVDGFGSALPWAYVHIHVFCLLKKKNRDQLCVEFCLKMWVGFRSFSSFVLGCIFLEFGNGCGVVEQKIALLPKSPSP